MTTVSLDARSEVAQWVCEQPQTARVFEQLHIDYCCKGGVPLEEACRDRGLDVEAVLIQLKQTTVDPSLAATEDWSKLPLSELCDHIQSTHHEYLRKALPRLGGLIDQVIAAHGKAHPELVDIRRVFIAMRNELEPHMRKEEQVLFPAIRHLEASSDQPRFPFGHVKNPIQVMEHEHDSAGQALTELRNLTLGYTPPADACPTYRVMLCSLQNLEHDIHQHVHKENNILFPRAEALQNSLNSTES